MRPARLESLILDAPVRNSVAGGRPSGGQVSVAVGERSLRWHERPVAGHPLST